MPPLRRVSVSKISPVEAPVSLAMISSNGSSPSACCNSASNSGEVPARKFGFSTLPVDWLGNSKRGFRGLSLNLTGGPGGGRSSGSSRRDCFSSDVAGAGRSDRADGSTKVADVACWLPGRRRLRRHARLDRRRAKRHFRAWFHSRRDHSRPLRANFNSLLARLFGGIALGTGSAQVAAGRLDR